MGAYASNILVNDISDHLPTICVLTSLVSCKKEPVRINSRDTRVRNLLALKTEIRDYDWSQLISDPCPSKNMDCVNSQLSDIIERCIPYKERRVNYRHLRREVWLTASLKLSIDRNKKLYAKMLKGECTKSKYSTYNKVLRKTIRFAKVQFYQNMCSEYKTNTKKLWGLINEISGKHSNKTSLIEYLKIDNVNEYNAKKISNRFAKYFAGVGKDFAEKIPKANKSITAYLKLLQSNKSSLFLEPTCEREIKQIVSTLPSKSSSGHDDISNILLKEIIDPLAKVLVKVFNKSMVTGVFPSVMKLAEIVPLYKSKEHYLENNYRPISLLMTISKILEKIIYTRVYSFLQDTGQIYDNQYGFRANHSCEHTVGQLVGSVVKGLENRHNVACVMLDLSKAFDTIDHTVLLAKLELYGVRGRPLAWFKSYLTDRKLRVKCRTISNPTGTKSEFHSIHYGTPQGSCLGPLIFLLFINDLHLNLSMSECIQFADDTTLVFVHRNQNYLRYCMESELAIVQDWFNANRLTLNVGKSSYLLFHGHTKNLSEFKIKLNNIEIPRATHSKFLGTWIDERLKWEIHANKILVKLKCGIGMLRRSKNLLSKKAKRLLYFGQIHSHLTYCLSIWGSMITKQMIQKLAKAQKNAVSLIEPTKKTNLVFRENKILTLTEMIHLEQCKLGYKLCHNLLPKRLEENMTKDHRQNNITKTHQYSTRSKKIPNLPQVSGSKYRSSFLYNSIKLYSDLSYAVKQSKNLHTFVKLCKQQCLSKPLR